MHTFSWRPLTGITAIILGEDPGVDSVNRTNRIHPKCIHWNYPSGEGLLMGATAAIATTMKNRRNLQSTVQCAALPWCLLPHHIVASLAATVAGILLGKEGCDVVPSADLVLRFQTSKVAIPFLTRMQMPIGSRTPVPLPTMTTMTMITCAEKLPSNTSSNIGSQHSNKMMQPLCLFEGHQLEPDCSKSERSMTRSPEGGQSAGRGPAWNPHWQAGIFLCDDDHHLVQSDRAWWKIHNAIDQSFVPTANSLRRIFASIWVALVRRQTRTWKVPEAIGVVSPLWWTLVAEPTGPVLLTSVPEVIGQVLWISVPGVTGQME